MSAVLLGQEQQGSRAWHALRTGGLGGSEVAAVLGLSPWVSPYALYQRKTGALDEQAQNDSMDWGHRLEPIVCDWWAEQHPEFEVVPAGTYRHSERTWQIANPDRLFSNGPGFLEVKTADGNNAWQWGPDGSDQIPPYYRTQLLHYGDVLGVNDAHVAVLIGGNDPRSYHVTWEPDEAEWLRDQASAFWHDHVLAGVPPMIDGSDATYEAVRSMHPDIDPDTEVEIDPVLFDGWESTAAEIKRLTEVMKRNRSRVAEQMGTARYGTVLGERVVIRQSTKAGAPYPKLIPAKKELAA